MNEQRHELDEVIAWLIFVVFVLFSLGILPTMIGEYLSNHPEVME